LTPSGKFVLGGLGEPRWEKIDFFVARLNANGSLDNTFDRDGYAVTDFDGYYDSIEDLEVLPDEKIVATGRSSYKMTKKPYTSYSSILTARFNANGKLDTSFAQNGYSRVMFYGSCSYEGEMYLNSQSILVAFDAGDPLTNSGAVQMARLLPNGSLDSSFGTNGLMLYDFPGPVDWGAFGDMTVDPFDGSIYASNSYGPATISKFLADGSLDLSYGGGLGYIQPGSSGDDYRIQLVVQPDGKLVAVWASLFFHSDVVWRFNPDGTPDTSFGVNGRVEVGGYDTVHDVTLDPMGNVIFVVEQLIPNTWDCQAVVIKLLPDGTPDPNFGAQN
jgi:uncharacterized delta-60 repeat protein